MLLRNLLAMLSLLSLLIALSSSSPERHLVVLPKEEIGRVNTERNATGEIVEISGVLPEMLQWLSLRYKFSYSYLQAIVVHTDDSERGRGAMGYLTSHEADLVLSAAPAFIQRYKLVDYTTIVVDDPPNFLIPFPKETIDMTNIAHPFTIEVWMLILVSIPIVVASLDILNRVMKKVSTNEHGKFWNTPQLVEYVVQVFFSQGGYCASSKLAVRLMTGAWCLGCFILVSAYSSVLLSFILAPHKEPPIINSLEDIASSSKHVYPMVETGSSFAVSFLQRQNYLHKYVGDMLRANPQLSCLREEECIDKVRTEKNYVFARLTSDLNRIVNEDFKKSGKCRLTIAKQPYSSPKLCFAMPKNSVYLEQFNIGIMRMWENGLLKVWEEKYIPKPSRCMKAAAQQTSTVSRVSLANISGAFVLLMIGYLVSVVAFAIERIVHRYNKKRVPSVPTFNTARP